MLLSRDFLKVRWSRVDAGLDMFDGIVPMDMLELVVEYLHLGLHHFQRGIVYQGHFFPTVDSIAIVFLQFHICSFNQLRILGGASGLL